MRLAGSVTLFTLGLLSGIVLLVLLEFRFAFVTTDFALFQTLLAVLAGGVITMVSTVYALDRRHRYNEEIRIKERKQEDIGLLFGVYVGLEELTSRFSSVKKHIDNSFNEPEAALLDDPWKIVPPTINKPVPDSFFSSDQLTVFIRAKAFAAYEALSLSQTQVLSTLVAWDFYCDQRRDFLASFEPDEMVGLVGSANLSGEQVKLYERNTAELNQLLGQIVKEIELNDAGIDRSFDELRCVARKIAGSDEIPTMQRQKL